MELTVTVTGSDRLYNRKRPRITARDRLCAVIGGYITDQTDRLLLHITSPLQFSVTTTHRHPIDNNTRPRISRKLNQTPQRQSRGQG